MSSTVSAKQELASRESFAQMLWGGGIIGFFVIQMTLWGVALFITHNDPSHRVVADYNQRTASWDQHRQELLASQQLGWTATIEVAPEADLKGNRQISLVVTDDQKKSLDLDKVQLQVFHRARAAEVQTVEMKAVAPNLWQGVAKMKKSGRWQFDGLASHHQQQLIIDQEQRLNFSVK